MNERWGEDVEGEFTNCPRCRQRIDPDDPANRRAVEMVPTGAFGTAADNNESDRGDGRRLPSRLLRPARPELEAQVREACPECGESVPAPGGAHGVMGQPMHSQRDCPGCGTPLIWWTEGHFAGEGWRVDDGEQRRRAHVAEYDD